MVYFLHSSCMYIYDIIGGIITQRDLADYRAHWVTPVTTTLQNGDYEVVSPPPPSSGVIVQLILKILDGKNILNISSSGITIQTLGDLIFGFIIGYFMKGDDLKTKEARLRTYHRTIEAFKFAYAKRSELGDARKIDLNKV